MLSWARLGAGDKTTLQLSFAYHYLHCRRREESRKDIFVKVGQSLKLENSVHGELGVLSPRTPGMARYVTCDTARWRCQGSNCTEYLALSRVSVCGGEARIGSLMVMVQGPGAAEDLDISIVYSDHCFFIDGVDPIWLIMT